MRRSVAGANVWTWTYTQFESVPWDHHLWNRSISSRYRFAMIRYTKMRQPEIPHASTRPKRNISRKETQSLHLRPTTIPEAHKRQSTRGSPTDWLSDEVAIMKSRVSTKRDKLSTKRDNYPPKRAFVGFPSPPAKTKKKGRNMRAAPKEVRQRNVESHWVTDSHHSPQTSRSEGTPKHPKDAHNPCVAYAYRRIGKEDR